MPESGSRPDGERTVQPSRFSWVTLIAGLCIGLTGAYFIWVGHDWMWFSLIQIGVGIWMVADGGYNLFKRYRTFPVDE